MSKHRVKLSNRRQRSILTDMLPFEVPPTFSNRGFYRFLRDHFIEINEGELRWTATNPGIDTCVRILFAIESGTPAASATITEWGKTRNRNSVPIRKCRLDTIPFNFQVAHNTDGRTLSVVHPRNQVEVAAFYADHSSLITYYSSLSEFSIRKPVSVSRFAFFKDKLHEQTADDSRDGVEEEGKEYKQLGSYFVYKKYRNIHKFFESYKYHRCEKKYDAMVQVDISKCFDSIYTHSLSWAIVGKAQTKFNLKTSGSTFGGNFDAVMSSLNHKETNGIVIGPEFSRVFAEIILQAIDVELLNRLQHSSNLFHRIDYEIFRYVDDYFIFYNLDSTKLTVIETLQRALREKKLSINSAKIKPYEKPIITEITVAKERVSSLFNSEIASDIKETLSDDGFTVIRRELKCYANANRLIVKYKTAIKESKVSYGDLLNYTFAILENKIERAFKIFCDDSDELISDQKELAYFLLAMMEFAFFVYSASPKVNHTIRLCRIITTSVKFLHEMGIPREFKHILFKYIHDNIFQQLEKNTMNSFRELESLYLLIALSEIGKEYWLPEVVLAKHFLISDNENKTSYFRAEPLNYFSITVLLSYIRKKRRYGKLRDFIEHHIVERLAYSKAHCPNDTECLMLFLDIIVCPYVSNATKLAVAAVFDLDQAELNSMQSANDYWFTAWGDKFNLAKELDAKRSREVY